MRVIILVIDGLGIGEHYDVKEKRFQDINSNTLLSIHKTKSLKNTFIDFVGLLDNNKLSQGYLKKKRYFTTRAELSYYGADSNLGHLAISGKLSGCQKVFLDDIKDAIIDLFKSDYDVRYENGLINLEDRIFISNNIECDPGININVLGTLDNTEYCEILKVGKLVRENISVSRVIVMGGKNLSKHTVYKSIEERDSGDGNTFIGINIPKADIYNEHYRVVHLSYSEETDEHMLKILSREDIPITLIGKTADLFQNLNADYIPMISTKGVMKTLYKKIKIQNNGLIFANVQELDLAGHLEDPMQCHKVLSTINDEFFSIVDELKEDDIFIITADHGNDPLIGHAYHTREYVPLIVISNTISLLNSYTKSNLCDIGYTVTNILSGKETEAGKKIFNFKK